MNRYTRSKYRNLPVHNNCCSINKSIENPKHTLEEVPTIQNLRDQVENLISLEENDFEASTFISWNTRFHQIIKKCNIQHYFKLNSLPQCYELGGSCGHVFQIELREALKNSLYLTMLDTIHQKHSSYNSTIASKFIQGRKI